MKKILYNAGFGGFGFSNELLQRFGITDGEYSVEGNQFCRNIKNRTNPEVILVVEEIGLKRASGSCCELAILEADDGDIYEIEEFDGKETLIYKGDLDFPNLIF